MPFDYKKDFPKSKTVSKDISSINSLELNGQRYLFAMFLDNGDQVVEMPHKQLNTLRLNDSLVENRMEGTLTYKDPNFSISRLFSKINSIVGEDCIKDKTEVTDFSFRGSGNEKLHLKLMPLSSDDEDALGVSRKLSSGNWIIQHTFIIKSVKGSKSTLVNKEYEIKFEDIVTHVLNNYRISEFPISIVGRKELTDTVESEAPEEFKQLDDYPLAFNPLGGGNIEKTKFTAAKTGEAIYWIIHKAFKEYKEKTGFDITGYLPKVVFTNGDFEVDDEELKSRKKTWVKKGDTYELVKGDLNPQDVWDFGPDESLLHSTLEGRTTNHLLKKFLTVHVSGVEHEQSDFLDPDKKSLANLDWEPCFLHLQRGEGEDVEPKITLRPLSSWLHNMGQVGGDTLGSEFMDPFLFKNEENFVDKTLGVIKSFVNAVNFCGDQEGKLTQVASPIEEFVYDPINPSDSAKFIVPHVVELTKYGVPIVAQVDGGFEFCKRYISELYLKNFTKQEDSNLKFRMINIDDDDNVKDGDSKIRIQNLVPTKPSMVAKGRNRLIKNMIFMNDILSFKIQGSVHRESGKFFGVDLLDGTDPNDEKLNRLLGVWWAANVTHEIDFRDKTYVNEITGVKFYRYRPIERTDDPASIDALLGEPTEINSIA